MREKVYGDENKMEGGRERKIFDLQDSLSSSDKQLRTAWFESRVRSLKQRRCREFAREVGFGDSTDVLGISGVGVESHV